MKMIKYIDDGKVKDQSHEMKFEYSGSSLDNFITFYLKSYGENKIEVNNNFQKNINKCIELLLKLKNEEVKEIDNYEEWIKTEEYHFFNEKDMPENLFELLLNEFKEQLENDSGLLIAWDSNIAMWFHDKCGITDYEKRNDLAQEFLKHFFNIDYDWRKLLG